MDADSAAGVRPVDGDAADRRRRGLGPYRPRSASERRESARACSTPGVRRCRTGCVVAGARDIGMAIEARRGKADALLAFPQAQRSGRAITGG